MLERGEGLLGRGEGMLGRGVPRPVRRFGPLALAFFAGYLLKLLDTPREHLSVLENDLPLFVGPSLSLLVLVVSSPSNSLVRDTIRNTWLSVSKKPQVSFAVFQEVTWKHQVLASCRCPWVLMASAELVASCFGLPWQIPT